jgi:hypothetical protein
MGEPSSGLDAEEKRRNPDIAGNRTPKSPVVQEIAWHSRKKQNSSYSSLFWDIKPCSPLQVNERFGENGASIFRNE